jgi:hypothetical protein
LVYLYRPPAPAPISQPSPIDLGPQGKSVKFGIRVWPVNGSMIKEELYWWLRLDRPTEESGAPYPPGYCHFPQYGEEYFKQITAEQLVTRVVKGYRRTEGRRQQIGTKRSTLGPTREPRAAVYGMDRFNDAIWKSLEDRVEEISKRVGQPPVPAPPAGPPQRAIRGRFFASDPPPRRW